MERVRGRDGPPLHPRLLETVSAEGATSGVELGVLSDLRSNKPEAEPERIRAHDRRHRPGRGADFDRERDMSSALRRWLILDPVVLPGRRGRAMAAATMMRQAPGKIPGLP